MSYFSSNNVIFTKFYINNNLWSVPEFPELFNIMSKLFMPKYPKKFMVKIKYF